MEVAALTEERVVVAREQHVAVQRLQQSHGSAPTKRPAGQSSARVTRSAHGGRGAAASTSSAGSSANSTSCERAAKASPSSVPSIRLCRRVAPAGTQCAQATAKSAAKPNDAAWVIDGS